MLLIALAATGGGILSAFLGWAGTKDPFNGKKFITSVGVATFAGVALALTQDASTDLGGRDYLLAFLSGSGADVLSNRARTLLPKHK